MKELLRIAEFRKFVALVLTIATFAGAIGVVCGIAWLARVIFPVSEDISYLISAGVIFVGTIVFVVVKALNTPEYDEYYE